MVPEPKCPAPKRRRWIGGTESVAPKRTRPVNLGKYLIFSHKFTIKRVILNWIFKNNSHQWNQLSEELLFRDDYFEQLAK